MKKRKVLAQYTDKELAESFVFRNNLSLREKQKLVVDLALAREKAKADGKKGNSRYFHLLQIQYQKEDKFTS